MGAYGYFDDAAREYVITNPKTPVKWINYLGTLDFGGFIDHTGGMLLCAGDPALNRLLKYIPQLPAADFKGSTLYVRLREEKAPLVFSPFFVPTLDELDAYACHVGLGYTRFVSEYAGLRTEVTVFVPEGESRLIQNVQITNISETTRNLDLIPVVEYSHPDALKQFNNADWVPQTMQSKAVWEKGGRVVLLQYPFMLRDTRVNFFTSSAPVDSFETDRQQFLGENGYMSWAVPRSLYSRSLGNHEALRGDNIAALLHAVGDLAPGQTHRLIVQLGQAESYEAAQAGIAAYRQPELVDQALAAKAAFWDGFLGRMQVDTPDRALNRILNVYNPRQCFVTKNWSRYLSLYQLGLGARGMGFRDSAQDVIGIVTHAPQQAPALLRKLLQVQLPDGSAMHQFNPLTMVANRGDSREVEGADPFYSDDHLWIVLATAAYLRETGDLAFLEEEIPFYQDDWGKPVREVGTVREHLQRAVAFTRRTTGAHGLPRLGFADWNDTVNLAPGAESLFTANLYGRALRDLLELAAYEEDQAVLEQYTADYEEMQEIVNQHAWDGDWYVRYFDAQGEPIGSQQNDAGQIYANGQSWPVLSGFAPQARARAALDAVYARLNTSCGIKLSAPGYDGYDPRKGGITTYPPGAKENGGIFLHANPWVIMAEAILGRGDRAYTYYAQINPALRNEDIDRFECEPYVYPQNILGDEHPQFGLARNSWLTGTATWALVAGTQYILGIQPTLEGLRVDPCLPVDWDGFSVTRQFRGATYAITITNPDHVSRGVRSVTLDGEPCAGDVLPDLRDGNMHEVLVLMGPVGVEA